MFLYLYFYTFHCLVLDMHDVFPYLYTQCWCLSLLVEILLLDSHTLSHAMSVLPVALVPLLCSGWVLAALPPLLLVETSLWAVHHPTLSPSTHCVYPMLDSTPVGLLLGVTLGQTLLWWIFQVCSSVHCTPLSATTDFKLQSTYLQSNIHSIPGSWIAGREPVTLVVPFTYPECMSVCLFKLSQQLCIYIPQH